jgi:hypothetical protein
MIYDWPAIAETKVHSARQRLGLRQSSGAFGRSEAAGWESGGDPPHSRTQASSFRAEHHFIGE